MKKIIASVLFFGSFGVAFAQYQGPMGGGIPAQPAQASAGSSAAYMKKMMDPWQRPQCPMTVKRTVKMCVSRPADEANRLCASHVASIPYPLTLIWDITIGSWITREHVAGCLAQKDCVEHQIASYPKTGQRIISCIAKVLGCAGFTESQCAANSDSCVMKSVSMPFISYGACPMPSGGCEAVDEKKTAFYQSVLNGATDDDSRIRAAYATEARFANICADTPDGTGLNCQFSHGGAMPPPGMPKSCHVNWRGDQPS